MVWSVYARDITALKQATTHARTHARSHPDVAAWLLIEMIGSPIDNYLHSIGFVIMDPW